jgi:hypothetical protein
MVIKHLIVSNHSEQQMNGSMIVNNELETLWNKAVVTLSMHCPTKIYLSEVVNGLIFHFIHKSNILFACTN